MSCSSLVIIKLSPFAVMELIIAANELRNFYFHFRYFINRLNLEGDSKLLHCSVISLLHLIHVHWLKRTQNNMKRDLAPLRPSVWAEERATERVWSGDNRDSNYRPCDRNGISLKGQTCLHDSLLFHMKSRNSRLSSSSLTVLLSPPLLSSSLNVREEALW